jgi:thiosulfate dehydrogenase [quinone] large subunit
VVFRASNLQVQVMRISATAQHDSDDLLKRVNSNEVSLAYALLRIALGVNIAIHGISRILEGPAVFVAELSKQFENTVLPHFAVQAFGYALPWLETVIGLLVLFGAWTGVALIAGALLICLLTFGSTLHQDWNVAGLQLIYAAVYSVLIGLRGFNSISVDGLFAKRLRTAGNGQS